jgi:hypothetical protein
MMRRTLGETYGPTLEQLGVQQNADGSYSAIQTEYAGPIYGPTLEQLGVKTVQNANGTVSYTRPSTGGIVQWLTANQTAVFITAGALFALAMFGGRR